MKTKATPSLENILRHSIQLIEMLESRVLLTVLLDPLTQPKFLNPLPFPGVIKPTTPGGNDYKVSISQFSQQLGLYDPTTGQALSTTVWGYNGSYPGPTLEARKGVPITVTWSNDLVDRTNKPLPHLLPVDTSIDWAFSNTKYSIAKNGVPVVTHLHGGHTESASDGLPEQWFTPKFKQTGSDWVKKTFTYANDQDAATLWYHDHALGITRLNVYAGLAGFYLLRDPAIESALNLPTGKYEVPLAIQDRMFTADGQLYYPSTPEEEGQPNPSILPEFFGDTILVNGGAWPFLNVEPRKYRFRLLNGSDSRVYTLHLSSGQSFTQIGADQGYLPAPATMNQITLAPGERADVIIDFAGLEGQTIIIRNNAKSPFPSGDTVDPNTVGQIMAFNVGSTITEPDSPIPQSLVPITPLVQSGATRQLLLSEGGDEFDRLEVQLGTIKDGRLTFHEPVTENPQLNDVEVWEIYNDTPDTHPIHVHLVHFQVLSRQKFMGITDPVTGALSGVRLLGDPSPPEAGETGFKDTVKINPGEVTRIIAKFDLPGKYVWHCHILSHEDHEMMRPYVVGAIAPAVAGADPTAPADVFSTKPVAPEVLDPSAPSNLLSQADTLAGDTDLLDQAQAPVF
ncbi:MAG TPA: multicopper oxidase [Tepidisphaeraceae bacterium]|nr:multicopper oxidase [Tepidisphaeraceae bacterium]